MLFDKEVGDSVGSRIADTEPDDLGGLPPDKTELPKVVVLGDQGEAAG